MDDWTPWRPLTACFSVAAVPSAPGLYRIRASGDDVLAYIGQTGRSLQERLRALRGVYGSEMPYRDPHTAAPALWAWLQSSGVELEAATRIVEDSVAMRKGAEAVAIAEHRQHHRVSPRWNFGRMPAGFRMSSANNSRLVTAGKRFRGGPAGDDSASHEPGIAPYGPLDPDVHRDSWAGHRWSAWQAMTRENIARTANTTGLYRIRGEHNGLVYIGEGKLRDRLTAHAAKLQQHTDQGAVLAACAPLEFSTVLGDWLPHQRLELETDLIAAHVIALGSPPPAQFIG